MTRALRSELVKLRRPRLLSGLLVACAASVLLASVVAFTAGDGRSSPPGLSDASADPSAPDGFLAGLHEATSLLGVIALAFCAWAIATEYSQGTLRNLLVREPRRLRLLAGTHAGLMAVLVLCALVATVVAAVAGLLLAGSQGIDTTRWDATRLLPGAGGAAIAMLGYGTIGTALGLLLRSPSSAIGIGVAWVLPVETILHGAASGLDRWLPGQLLQAVAHGGSDAVSSGRALTVLALYLAVAAGICARTFARRDVAA